MKWIPRVVAVLWLAAVGVGLCGGQAGFAQQAETRAPLLEGMGEHSFPITTTVADSATARLVQRYFDQGLMLHYGFNHTEAIRSFEQAQELDPEAPMPYWGEALARGPHLNAAMAPSNVGPAVEAIRKAQELASQGTQKEQDYIEALAARYGPESSERGAFGRAYVEAMREVAEKYPEGADAQALFAEALMVLSKYDYWQANGEPNVIGAEIVSTLEASMERDPMHPGTNHFYIHTVEIRHPKRGEEAADRMRDLVPGIGHLQHMPSHIYLQIGRYADASTANEKAVEADREYNEKYGARGMYRISYMPHNAIYLTFSAAMEGRSAKTIEAAETVRELTLENPLRQPGYGSLTQGWALGYYAMVRFGKWEELKQEPKPEEGLLYPTAVWRYARGLAFAHTGQLDSARAQWEQLTPMTEAAGAGRMDVFSPNTARKAVQIAAKTLAGEIAAASGDYEAAIGALREAVEIESTLGYHEPPAWFIPSRQTLGGILLAAGRASEAEEVYRADLAEFPSNGWSLWGLAEALAAQGETEEAEQVRERFEEAWERADVEVGEVRG